MGALLLHHHIRSCKPSWGGGWFAALSALSFWAAPAQAAVPGADWEADSDLAGSWFGYDVQSAGDVNGDGYADVIIGVPHYDDGQDDEGAAVVYHGGPAGLGAAPDWAVASNQAQAEFGADVASAGDVNGDGYSDVIVGARAWDNGENSEGAAFVYLGSPSGLGASPAWVAEENVPGAQLGNAVGCAGDVNNDGYDDVIVGSHYYQNGQAFEGAAYLYLGSPVGLQSSPAWMVESNVAGGAFGSEVASAGDVNGDGYDDVIIGAQTFEDGQTDEGAAFVFHGFASGLRPTPAWMTESNQPGALLGVSVATAGDVNADGFDDVIVGAMTYDNGHTDEGRAWVFLGSPSGVQMAATWTGEANRWAAYFGTSVASGGDVNGDGFADVVVGASGHPDRHEGAAFLYLGSAAGPQATAAVVTEGNQRRANMGFSVASAGDVDADGFDDVIVGAMTYDNGQDDEGAAFVFHGR